MAVEWKDIDYDRKVINITKTLQTNIKDINNEHKTSTYSRIKNSPKTKAGIRVLPLNETLITYLEKFHAYSIEHGIQADFICSTQVGTRNTPRNLQRSLKSIIKRAGIDENVTLHTLRHTFGSTLLRRGVNIEMVSKLMGHSNIMVTYNKYIHVLQEEAKTMQNVSVL